MVREKKFVLAKSKKQFVDILSGHGMRRFNHIYIDNGSELRGVLRGQEVIEAPGWRDGKTRTVIENIEEMLATRECIIRPLAEIIN